MLLSNTEMVSMLIEVEPLLDRVDKIGYAAARNTRILRNAAAEYLTMQDQFISELGEPELDENGNPTGRIGLSADSPNFEEFQKRMRAIADIETDVEIFTLPMEEAIGNISGTQLLELEWMFTEGGE